MEVGDVLAQGITVSVPLAIAKGGIDATRRTVRGLMTQEVVDSHGEEVDFESVKSCLDTWRGNVREMHQPKAVGKAVDIVVRDDIKAVEVETYVSRGAEDTWLKCQDGTLGFYSIGGVADRVYGPRSDGTRGPRLLMRKIGEMSLVDSGSCPTSSITVVKSVDGVPVEQLAAEAPMSDPPAVPAAVALTILKGLGFRSQRWNINNALTVIALLEDIVSEQCWEMEYIGENVPDNAGQVELLKLAVAIVLDFIATEFEQQFVGEALAKLADADQAAVRAVIEKAGARHSKADLTMLQAMHDNCVKLGASCGVEKMADTPKTETPTPAPPETPAAASTETPAVPVAEVTKAVDSPIPTPTAASAPEPVLVQGLQVPTLEAMISKAVDAASQAFETKLAEQKATSDATIATLQEQVTKLAAEPAPGGPVANAHAQAIVVEKNGGNLAEVLADVDIAKGVVVELEKAAAAETDPRTREVLVTKALGIRRAHGLDAVAIANPR